MVHRIRKKKDRIVGVVNGKRIKTSEKNWTRIIEHSEKVGYKDERILVETNERQFRKGHK